jgi:hypothetical protein
MSSTLTSSIHSSQFQQPSLTDFPSSFSQSGSGDENKSKRSSIDPEPPIDSIANPNQTGLEANGPVNADLFTDIGTCFLLELPPEMISAIADFLDLKNLLSGLSATCKYLQGLFMRFVLHELILPYRESCLMPISSLFIDLDVVRYRHFSRCNWKAHFGASLPPVEISFSLIIAQIHPECDFRRVLSDAIDTAMVEHPITDDPFVRDPLLELRSRALSFLRTVHGSFQRLENLRLFNFGIDTSVIKLLNSFQLGHVHLVSPLFEEGDFRLDSDCQGLHLTLMEGFPPEVGWLSLKTKAKEMSIHFAGAYSRSPHFITIGSCKNLESM